MYVQHLVRVTYSGLDIDRYGVNESRVWQGKTLGDPYHPFYQVLSTNESSDCVWFHTRSNPPRSDPQLSIPHSSICSRPPTELPECHWDLIATRELCSGVTPQTMWVLDSIVFETRRDPKTGLWTLVFEVIELRIELGQGTFRDEMGLRRIQIRTSVLLTVRERGLKRKKPSPGVLEVRTVRHVP